MNLYQFSTQAILFDGLQMDPEWVHQQVMQVLSRLDRAEQPSSRWFRGRLAQLLCLNHPRLSQDCWGLTVPNPVGLAAGFDKDGLAAGIWSDLGFGFTELGTVTFQAQPGNPRPRLFRLPDDDAALNRMGFNNRGAMAMAERLSVRCNAQNSAEAGIQAGENSQVGTGKFATPVGINLGKSKVTSLEEATQDYVSSFRLLQPWGDYFVVNVSSPNTPGLRSLQAVEQLEPILLGLQQENSQHKPLLVKIAPDLEWDEIAAIVDLAQRHRLAGVIATNTTIRREGLKTQILAATGQSLQEESGGISGAPLRQRSTEIIRFIRQQTGGKLMIVGVGGIFTAEHAWEKIVAGASLVQVYTGWIYRGPWMVRQILAGLLQKLDQQGMGSIAEAVGSEASCDVN
ncbi:dihydroorotate dehydrogenase (quinone) [Leptolyngbya sp. 'hensonii']|uniref:quinone-dependent dihydroorotate dehydrogenase n=1 Tax=Leptolyngbya sp. 'hensonii' TaxID=1922337 RepID=UPI0009501499|nr:quinone-dependent dihydroorotate dehydrogenase [Leptolyngbya sp. 'hensonii']OLP16856.1 dihydroorotate dehydrogenase (quinone) [Leptolyngbya sp. 'hensonii']